MSDCTYRGDPHPLGKSYWQVPAQGYELRPGTSTMDICDDCHKLWLKEKEEAK